MMYTSALAVTRDYSSTVAELYSRSRRGWPRGVIKSTGVLGARGALSRGGRNAFVPRDGLVLLRVPYVRERR